jgi:hypothetical protein
MSRNRKRRQDREEDHSESQNPERTEPFRPEPIPEEKVPKQFLNDGSYKEAGSQCRECSFRTRKRGFSGKQALRAHLKKHVNERRAARRPMLHQIMLVILTVCFLVAISVVPSNPRLMVELPINAMLMSIGFTIGSVGIAGLLYWVTGVAGTTFARSAIRLARFINFIATGFVIGIGLLWALSSPAPVWYGSIAPIGMTVLTVLAAGENGRSSHGAKSGRWRSPRYGGLLRPKNEDAELEFEFWKMDIVTALRSGRTTIETLKGPARAAGLSWARWDAARRKKSQRRRPKHP